jgi:hypothetical protein
MASGEGIFRRSESVRARRTQRRVEKPAVKRAEYSRSRDVPRMVSRNAAMEQQLRAGGSRVEARRRRTLQLASDGAELRLPALPSVHIGWRAVSAGIALVMSLLLYMIWNSTGFLVSRVELSGAQRLSAQDVNSVLGVAGASVFEMLPADIEERVLANFPEIASLDVKVGFPARVIVQAVERRPVILWEQADISVWLDENGIAFVPQGEAAGLVTVQALEAPPALEGEHYARHQLIRPEMIEAIAQLSLHVPEGATLIYDAELGFGWDDPAGWQAFFGQDGKNMPQRIAVYQSLLAELSSRRLVPTLISVAQVHAPYYRLDY